MQEQKNYFHWWEIKSLGQKTWKDAVMEVQVSCWTSRGESVIQVLILLQTLLIHHLCSPWSLILLILGSIFPAQLKTWRMNQEWGRGERAASAGIWSRTPTHPVPLAVGTALTCSRRRWCRATPTPAACGARPSRGSPGAAGRGWCPGCRRSGGCRWWPVEGRTPRRWLGNLRQRKAESCQYQEEEVGCHPARRSEPQIHYLLSLVFIFSCESFRC